MVAVLPSATVLADPVATVLALGPKSWPQGHIGGLDFLIGPGAALGFFTLNWHWGQVRVLNLLIGPSAKLGEK